MGIRFACHVCSKSLNIKQELAGKRGVCPACSAKFRIPLQDSQRSTPVEEKPQIQQVAAEPKTDDPVSGDLQQIDALIDDPEATWYVRPPSGGQYGPADSSVLRQWIDEGRVAATALLWRDGWPQWRTASETLPGLALKLPNNASPSSVGVSTVSSAQKRESEMESAASSGNSVTTNHAFREGGASASRPGDCDVGVEPPGIISGADELPTDFTGDQAVGTKRKKKTYRRILTIAMLSVIVLVLLGVLFFLMNR